MGLKLAAPLDPDMGSQTIEEGIKYVISKTQENCKLARVFRANYSTNDGDVLATYLHNKLSDNIGKIGSVFVSIFLGA